MRLLDVDIQAMRQAYIYDSTAAACVGIDQTLEFWFGYWCQVAQVRPSSERGREMYQHMREAAAVRRQHGYR